MLRNHLGDGIFFLACLSSLTASSEAMLDSDIFINIAANSLTPYWALFPVENPIDADSNIPDEVLRSFLQSYCGVLAHLFALTLRWVRTLQIIDQHVRRMLT